MTTHDYRKALKTAREEKAKLLAQKGDIEMRVAQLNQSIYTLMRLCGESTERMEHRGEDADVTGITGAIRNVLRSSKEPLGSRDVKNILVELGFPIKGTNPQASVHVILKRLHSQGETAEVRVNDKGRATTKWSWKQIGK